MIGSKSNKILKQDALARLRWRARPTQTFSFSSLLVEPSVLCRTFGLPYRWYRYGVIPQARVQTACVQVPKDPLTLRRAPSSHQSLLSFLRLPQGAYFARFVKIFKLHIDRCQFLLHSSLYYPSTQSQSLFALQRCSQHTIIDRYRLCELDTKNAAAPHSTAS